MANPHPIPPTAVNILWKDFRPKILWNFCSNPFIYFIQSASLECSISLPIVQHKRRQNLVFVEIINYGTFWRESKRVIGFCKYLLWRIRETNGFKFPWDYRGTLSIRFISGAYFARQLVNYLLENPVFKKDLEDSRNEILKVKNQFK